MKHDAESTARLQSLLGAMEAEESVEAQYDDLAQEELLAMNEAQRVGDSEGEARHSDKSSAYNEAAIAYHEKAKTWATSLISELAARYSVTQLPIRLG